ncbi:hypothetical protein AB1Y20_017711 [Prymnesium parvum]|uniref:ADP,ATP carrier protein n=1 Tax=Prymnesium parvum TaxID=97485 RepID=A0AB34JM09_PRYPA
MRSAALLSILACLFPISSASDVATLSKKVDLARPNAGRPAPRQRERVAASAAADLVAVAPAAAQQAVLMGSAPKIVLSLLIFVAANAELSVAAAAAGAASGPVVPTLSQIFAKSAKKALGGGLAGSLAGIIQVLTLMWVRTIMNYQYRYGTSIREAMTTLYRQGGIGRFYQGFPLALLQTPLSRFGDTAANTGVLALLAALAPNLNVAFTTAFASLAGSLWRIAITPVDTLKTTLQVEGKAAMRQIADKVKAGGPLVLYQGAMANAIASFVGSYPWYFTFNLLRQLLPAAPANVVHLKLLRNAASGFGATCVSDCISNFIRVLKTTVQTAPTTMTYREAAQQIIEADGLLGLFARGLGTRLIANGIQASLFSVLWKLMEEKITQ